MRSSSIETPAPDSRWSLTVVGTGIRLIGQITREALAAIDDAQVLLYLVADPALATWLERRNPSATPLAKAYRKHTLREDVYEDIAERILAAVREGHRVCAAFYGHPGIFVRPGHVAVRRAREEGFEARMLPGVSAFDCLVADLGVDPGGGLATYEATDYLVRRRRADPTIALVLWQIGLIGMDTVVRSPVTHGLPLLTEALLADYPADHRVAVYQATRYPVFESSIDWMPLEELPSADVTLSSTLFVPRVEAAVQDATVIDRLDRAQARSSGARSV